MNDRISALLGAAQESLREQLEAAERTFERLQRALDARDSAQIATLNHAVRRLRATASGGDRWPEILVTAARTFSDRTALFALRDDTLRVDAVRGIDLTGATDLPLAAAPAFRACVESKDSVVAMRTEGEMSVELAARFGEAAERRFYLFPVTARDRVVAVLYADAEQGIVQLDALELLATVAGAVAEPLVQRPGGDKALVAHGVSGQSSTDQSTNGLISITGATASDGADDRELHLRAQRFARVQVAEIRLYKSESVKNGRTGRDLYTSLKTEIDSARENYHRDFISRSTSMVDYLHEELVRTLANDDVALLGPGYPGPLH